MDWGFPVFGNLIDLHPKKGTITPILNTNLYHQKCVDNCNIFNEEEKNKCKEYCHFLIDKTKEATEFAKNSCPSGDKICCKQIAKDNDIAYLNCIGQQEFLDSSAKNPARFLFFFFLIIILIIIFLYLLISK